MKVTVDGKLVEIEQGMTVMHACEQAGVEIPRFCYHDKLEIAGNCRMCLVELEGGPPKPVASCAMPASDGMVIKTTTDMVKKAREGVMEFLLINHPLDCPICDQGGECDLQDQAMLYGRGVSRYNEPKRALSTGNYGPLIKTHMTRCIHCTRCIRFAQEIAGERSLGAFSRGENTEVTTYIESSIKSELSGNIIDLCPVGALTSRPYQFKARPWEMTGIESIDVMDSLCSNIRIDVRGREVMRILPSPNDDINEDWISDKARFSYDGLKKRRIDRPYLKRGNKFLEANWNDVISAVAHVLSSVESNEVGVIAGGMTDVESMFALKKLAESLGVTNLDSRPYGNAVNSKHRASYIFSTKLADLEKCTSILLLACNPKKDVPVLNARLRNVAVANNIVVDTLCVDGDLNYRTNDLGKNLETLKQILSGEHEICNKLQNSEFPLLVIGEDIYQHENCHTVINLVYQIANKYNIVTDSWNGFNVLFRNSSVISGLDMGFVPKKGGVGSREIVQYASHDKIKVVYLLNADDFDVQSLKDSFVIYQGHHGDKAAEMANVILPSASYVEKDAMYVNLEGRIQMATRAVYPPNLAKEDWTIIVDIARKMQKNLGFTDIDSLRQVLFGEYPNFLNIGQVISPDWCNIGSEGKDDVVLGNFSNTDYCYYSNNAICRSSVTMKKCAEEFSNKLVVNE